MKKVLILLLLLLLTGCTATYNVRITKDSYEENVDIVEENTSNLTKIAYDAYYGKMTYNEAAKFFTVNDVAIVYSEVAFNDTMPIDKVYDRKLKDNSINYNYKFNLEDYSKSTLVNICYPKFYTLAEDNIVNISTGKDVRCFELFPLLDSIIVNVKSDYIVTNSNADKIDEKNNVYTWNLDKENSKQIFLNVDKSKKFIKNPILNWMNNHLIITALLILTIIGSIAFIIIYIKDRKNNRI